MSDLFKPLVLLFLLAAVPLCASQVISTKGIFMAQPAHPGLDSAVRPMPPNYICPHISFEPKSPRESMRYGVFKYSNKGTPEPVHWCTLNEACAHFEPLSDTGYISELPEDRPPRNSTRFEITQIIQRNDIIDFFKRDIWVCWKAPTTDRVGIVSNHAATVIVVYAGCGCGPLTAPLIGCVDGKPNEAEGDHYSKKLVWDVEEYHDYLLRFGTLTNGGDDATELEFKIEVQPPPTNPPDVTTDEPID
eukprot:Selendium_serpulae@DN1843_c0_g1_i1.p1